MELSKHSEEHAIESTYQCGRFPRFLAFCLENAYRCDISSKQATVQNSVRSDTVIYAWNRWCIWRSVDGNPKKKCCESFPIAFADLLPAQLISLATGCAAGPTHVCNCWRTLGTHDASLCSSARTARNLLLARLITNIFFQRFLTLPWKCLPKVPDAEVELSRHSEELAVESTCH